MGCGASSSAASPFAVSDVSAAAPAATVTGRGVSAGKLNSIELLSSVRAYVESPAFAAPLSNWIDENCVKFTKDCMEDSSMEPAYRGCHSQYIAFTDALLTAHLMQFGISLMTFYRKPTVQCHLPRAVPLCLDTRQYRWLQARVASTGARQTSRAPPLPRFSPWSISIISNS